MHSMDYIKDKPLVVGQEVSHLILNDDDFFWFQKNKSCIGAQSFEQLVFYNNCTLYSYSCQHTGLFMNDKQKVCKNIHKAHFLWITEVSKSSFFIW